MKITVTKTIIDASAEELRQSNTLADSVAGLLRSAFNGCICDYDDVGEDEGVGEDDDR